MTHLEELIQAQRTVGVQYVMFPDVCSYIRGITYNKAQEVTEADANSHRVLRANNITLSSNTLNFDDVKYISSDVKVKEAQWLRSGDILMCASSGSQEHVGKVAYIDGDLDYTFGGFMAVIRCGDEVSSKYMFHVLSSGLFANHLKDTLKSNTIKTLNGEAMNAFSFPLPEIDIQEEIVRILDEYAEKNNQLIYELRTEIEARKKQYDYYLSKMLTFENSVEWQTMKEALVLKAGKNISSSKIVSEIDESHIYACYGGNNIRGYVSDYNRDGKYPIIGRQGALCGNVCLAEGKFYATEHAVVVENQRDFDADFLFFLLTKMDLNQYKTVGAQPGLSVERLNKVKIPVPPIGLQRKIAQCLKEYTKEYQKLIQVLNQEIALRLEQYSYYRDALLSFSDAS